MKLSDLEYVQNLVKDRAALHRAGDGLDASGYLQALRIVDSFISVEKNIDSFSFQFTIISDDFHTTLRERVEVVLSEMIDERISEIDKRLAELGVEE